MQNSVLKERSNINKLTHAILVHHYAKAVEVRQIVPIVKILAIIWIQNVSNNVLRVTFQLKTQKKTVLNVIKVHNVNNKSYKIITTRKKHFQFMRY